METILHDIISSMTDTNIPYFEDEESKLNPNLPIVERAAINAIVYDLATDEVLCLDWEKFNWKTFIIGGIENDEDPIIAASREILEETGFKNIQFIAEVGRTKSGYYATHKKENRISNAVGLLFKLINSDQIDVKESEVVNHVFRWIPKDNVGSYINLSSQKYIWERALERLNQKV